DVAVVGAGPAGLSAALAAAEAGGEVLLIDEGATLGGALAHARFDANGTQAERIRKELLAAVQAKSNLRVLSDAMCSGLFADNWLPVIRGNRLHKLRATSVVIATGTIEQPAVFRNNDLPGVMF